MEWTLEGLRQPHRYVLDAAQLHIYMLMKKVGTFLCHHYPRPSRSAFSCWLLSVCFIRSEDSFCYLLPWFQLTRVVVFRPHRCCLLTGLTLPQPIPLCALWLSSGIDGVNYLDPWYLFKAVSGVFGLSESGFHSVISNSV